MRAERKASMMVVKENIEMELFSSEEPCAVIQTQEEKEQLGKYTFDQMLEDFVTAQRHHSHPLVLDEEDDEEDPELPVRTQTSRNPPKAKREPAARGEQQPCSPDPGAMEETEIEMQMFPSNSVADGKPAKAPKKAASLKWKRVLQNAGLVVKDVVCLPSGYLAHLDRRPVPCVTQRASPTVNARVTIDSDWSAVQMQSCLSLFFSRWFVKPAGRRLSFTFLQCVQGSSVLFVPDTPAEGWTGRRVLRISEHGPLYVLSHLDSTQAHPDKSLRNRRFCVDDIVACCLDEVRQESDKEVTLGSLLRLHRHTDPGEEIQVRVKRGELLHGALKVVARPNFCFRKTPVVSFSGEETDRSQPIREFFRLVLMGLQESSVFEGVPGRLLLTYDLAALEMKMYYKAGLLIGWSLAHGGPGPRCLHPALYQLMCSQNPPLEEFSCGDLVNAEVRSRLEQLHCCTDVRSISPRLSDWVLSCGISGISLQTDEIPAIYSSVVKHFIYHRVASMIFQFKEGLNGCGGLWDLIESHWETFAPVMTSVRQRPLTQPEFQQLFSVRYSQSEGPLRAAEEATVGHWESVLEEVGDGWADFSFEDLLTFITGADGLPPLGLPTPITLHFYSQDVNESCVRLPYASASGPELFLPRGATTAAELLMLLSRALHEAQGFRGLQTVG